MARQRQPAISSRCVRITLAEIARVVGPSAADALLTARGGTRIYIPTVRRLESSHWLVGLLGQDEATKLCRNFSPYLGGYVNLQSRYSFHQFERWLAVRDMTRRGESARVIARHFGVTERTITRIRTRLREEKELP
ncbi:MAG: helix-turn-helix domain-containing protein [Bauldia sp.]